MTGHFSQVEVCVPRVLDAQYRKLSEVQERVLK